MRAPAPNSASLAPVLTRLTDAEFGRFQSLVHRLAGIWLSPAKKALLCGRLARRVRELGLGSLGRYYDVVERDEAERVHMLDCITTNETHFFREPRHFEILAQRVYPAWIAEAEAGRRPRRVRVWSAACSTGEEPYSLAMSLLRAFPAGHGWELEVLATDLSTRVLERAREAVWPIAKQHEIPPADLRAFMLRGVDSQEGRMKAGPEIRELVRFARVNLNDAAYPVVGQFDLIFCRNVLIYFDARTKAQVIQKLRTHLAPAGHLFLGHAESLGGGGHGFQPLFPTVYVHAATPVRRAG